MSTTTTPRANALPRVPSSGAVAVTLVVLVASLSYAGAVTTFALSAFVLPAVVLAALVVAPLAFSGRIGFACIAGLGTALGWSELVNVVSGTTNGPAARSSMIVGACSVLAMVALATRFTALFLAPVAGAIFGAMALGAGGEVRTVSVATAVTATFAMTRVERGRRRWASRPQRSPAVLSVALLVAVAAVGAVIVQGTRDHRRPDVLARAQTDASIKPQWTDPLATTVRELQPSRVLLMPYGAGTKRLGLPRRPAPRHHRRQTQMTPNSMTRAAMAPSTNVARRSLQVSSKAVNLALLALLLLLGLVVAWLDGRMISARLAWWRTRRRSRRKDVPAELVIGAWTWAGLRLAACRLALPVAMSPDVAMRDGTLADLPDRVAAPLRDLAALTNAAAFAGSADDAAASRAWTLAWLVNRAAEQDLSRFGRLRLAFRRPVTPAKSPRQVRHLKVAMSHD